MIPSLWAEPLPYVCVESVHAGKSLICASSGGIPEIAGLGSMVCLFPAGSVDALGEKMNLALNSTEEWRHRRVPECSKLVQFQEDYVVDRYLREYAPEPPTSRKATS